MDDAIVTVKISESFYRPVEIRLENRRLPRRAQNYCAAARCLPRPEISGATDPLPPPYGFGDLTDENQEKVIPLPTREAIELLETVEQARIPPMGEGGMCGCDGVTYEVRFGDGFFNSAVYRWWVKAPAGWEPLESLVKTLWAYARSSFMQTAAQRKREEEDQQRLFLSLGQEGIKLLGAAHRASPCQPDRSLP